jgi:HAD superfamily hydrolase (TIGR01509 family)
VIRALLFDFDGLVLDTEGPSYRAWAEVYDRHGQDLTLDVWSSAIGTIDGFDPVGHLAQLGVTVDEEAQEARRRRDLDLCDLEELRPGVTELLDEADERGLAKAIVSSSSEWWIERHLEHRGLLDRFDALVCANGDAARAKPRPTLYLEAIERLGIAPEAAVAFEDSPNGVAGAKAAGLYTIAVPNEVTSTLDLSAADRVVESLAELRVDDLEQELQARR